MGHRIEVADTWRNFIPVAPDLEITVFKNKGGFIDLHGYLVQGARDQVTGEPDDLTLQNLGAQRGWLCDYYVTSDPLYGKATLSMQGQGFDYRPMQNFIGRDCFSYVVNNGSQTSAPGKITVTIQDYYSGRINVTSRNVVTQDTGEGSGEYRFSGNFYIPPTLGPWEEVQFTWHQIVPYRSDVSGTATIYYNREEIASTVWALADFSDVSTLFKAVSSYWTPWIPSVWPSPILWGEDSLTRRPYRQPKGPYPVELTIEFVRTPRFDMYFSSGGVPVFFHQYWAERESILLNVTANGDDWYDNGDVTDADAPGWIPDLGGEYLPNLFGGDADSESVIGPQLLGTLPGISNEAVPADTAIELVFDRTISSSGGAVVIYEDDGDALVEVISLDDSQRTTIVANTVFISSTSALDFDTAYYILIGTEALQDVDGDFYEGIQDKLRYYFKTEVDPETENPELPESI